MVARCLEIVSKQDTVANSITEAKYVAAFKRDKKDVESYSSFMNLVWFQDGFCRWDTTAGSCSITQSEESRFNPGFTYIQSQVHTKYEFCEGVKTQGICKDTHGAEVARSVGHQAIPQAKHIYTNVS